MMTEVDKDQWNFQKYYNTYVILRLLKKKNSFCG